jgi:hypothetical protein
LFEPGFSSSTEKPRPSAGRTPSIGNRSAVTALPAIFCGSPTPVRLKLTELTADIPSNECVCVFQSMKLAGAGVFFGNPRRDASSHNITSRSGAANGSGLRSTALTRLKMAVFAPMPSASVNTAMTVNPGRFNSMRKPKRMSCHRIVIGSPLRK